MDSTCRIWSTRRGEQLFQVNLPAPVNQVQVDIYQNIYCICQNRLVVLSTQCLFKEDDLPLYWREGEARHMLNELHRGYGKDGPIEQGKPTGMSELQKLIAHGLLLPKALNTIVSQYERINGNQLHHNMKKVIWIHIV